MNVNHLKRDTVYVLTKDFIINNNDLNGILAVFNKDDEDTLIDPVIDEVQNSETTLTFQVPASSEKWKTTYNPENLYLADGKIFSANFTDSIERERNEDGEDIITIVAYEGQKLLEREFVRAWNSTAGFDNIDDFMVVILSGGDLPLVNNGNNVTTTHEKGTSGYVLDGLLFGTGWTTGICDVEGTFDLETDQTSIYENIMQVQEIWGGILVFDSLNKIVHHRNETQWLPYSGFEVRYQKNLQSSKYIGDNKIITYLCPLGEGGLNIKDINNGSLWLINTDYTNSVLRGIENNDNIYEQDQLKRWGERKLQDLCKPRRELTMTTALLNTVEGYEHEEVHLNDIVDVIDFEFVEDRVTQLRVIEYKHYLWSGADAELVIGDITLESTDIFKKTAKATNLINNGTLDTTKVVDYYKNGQSLRKTLRQIDQTIVDTKTELELADDYISARITQTNTRVDNLNNDIISQDQRITQLIIDVDGIDSKVSTLADLTETRTSWDGYMELENAVEGYLLGISIQGYDGSFGSTYVSENTILGEDTVLLGNTVSFTLHTKNNVPTKPQYYEMGSINTVNGEKISSNDYLRNKNMIKVEPEAIMYFSIENIYFAFGDVYFYDKYYNYINSWNVLHSEDIIKNLSGKQIAIPQNCYYLSYTIQNKFILDFGDAFELGDIDPLTGTETTSNSVYKSTEFVELSSNSIDNYLILKFEKTGYVFDNIYLYDDSNNYIGNWNTINPTDPITGLKEKNLKLPSNVLKVKSTLIRENRRMLLSAYPIESQNHEPQPDSSSDDYSYISYDNIPEDEYEELELVPDSIPGIRPQLEYNTEKTDYIAYNTKRYEFELDGQELREMWEENKDILPKEITDYVLGYYDDSDGTLSEDSETAGRFCNVNLIEIFPHQNLHITVETDYKLADICFYDKDKEFLGTIYTLYGIIIANYQNDIQFNVLSSIKYMNINVEIKDSTTPELEDMIEDADLKAIAPTNRIYDEFTIIEKNAMLIRRIGIDGQGNKYELTNPEYHDYGEVEVETVTGLNILEVDYWTPTIIVEYAAQSKYTDLFATKVELSTQIKQTDEYIELTASKLVSKDGIIVDLNSRLHMDAEKILIESNKIRIASSYGTWDYDGYFTTTYAKIANWNLKNGLLFSNTAIGNKTYQSGLDSRSNDYLLYAGVDVTDGASHPLSEANAYITKSGRIYAKYFEVNGESGTFYVKYDNGQTAMIFDKDSTWRYLPNGNKWTVEGIGFVGSIPDGHILWIYDAKYYSIVDGVHNLSLAKFTRVGNNSEPSRIDFYTTCYINGSPIQTGSSDERLKEDIKKCDKNALEIIKDIDFYSFNWKEDKKHVDIGFVAQKLQKQYDKLVIHSEGTDNKNNPIDTYQIDLLNTLALTTKGVQELNEKIIKLEKENQKLKEKNKKLEERLLKIEEMLNMKSE